LLIILVYNYIEAYLEKDILATQACLFLPELIFEDLWAVAEVLHNG
jgi:hypothetical protein